MKRKLTSVFVIIISGILFTGCFDVDGNFLKIKQDIFSTTGFQYYRDKEFGIGGLGIGMARMIVNLSDDDQEAKEILGHISKVQIGIYKCSRKIPFNDNSLLINRIDSRMNSEGWHYVVKCRNGLKMNIIYVKTNSDFRLKEIFIINFKLNKLELVEVKGNLDDLIQLIIKDKGMNINNTVAYR